MVGGIIVIAVLLEDLFSSRCAWNWDHDVIDLRFLELL